MNTFDLALDLDKRAGVTQWVTLRQGDHNGTVLKATIYDHGVQVGGGYTCRVSIRHPGTGETYYRETANYSNGVATVTIDEQYAAAIVGITSGYFELLQGSAVIASTEDFGVRILRSATDGAVPGEKYDSAIEDALAELDEATGRISQMVVDATEEYLEAHPEITTTVQDNSLTDAKLVQRGGILSRVERLWYRLANLLTATPAESDVLTVPDAAKTPLAGLSLYGRSTQDGTPTPDAPVPIQSVTPQLLDLSTLTAASSFYTQSEGGRIRVIATDNRVWSAIASFPLSGGTYTFMRSNTKGTVTINFYDESDVQLSTDGQVNISTGVAVRTLTVPSECHHARIKVGYGAPSYPFVTALSLYGGTLPEPFVPYDGIGVMAQGANLLDPSITFYDTRYYAVNVDGTVTVNAADTESWPNLPALPLKAGSYVFDVHGGNAGGRVALHAYYGSSDVPFLIDDNGMATFTMTQDGYIKAKVYNGTFPRTVQIQVVRGTTRPSEFHPYESVTIPISLRGLSLRSVPDGTRDEVTVDEWGKATLIQRVYPVTIDGTNYKLFHNANGYCSGGYSLMKLSPTDGSATWVQCDRFPRAVAAGGCYVANKTFVIRYGNGFNPTSQAELDAWFQANPTTFQFALATPQTIDLGTVDPIALQGPDMTAQAVPTAPFELTYERDLNVTLARLEASIAEVATA